MSSDRLRQAADILDSIGDVDEYVQRDRVTAALLRAVAAITPRPDETAEECYVWDRAYELADAVLGPTSVGDSGLNSNSDDETCGGCEHPRWCHDDKGCIECKCWRYVP